MREIVNILAVSAIPLFFLFTAYFLNRKNTRIFRPRRLTQYFVRIPGTGYEVDL